MVDLRLTAYNLETLKKRTQEGDIILQHANMKVKRWIFYDEQLTQSQDGLSVSVGDHESPEGQ